ncbi:MAG TPA: putative metalloprotease CJM1_0395 family protein [Polyangia bacterium]|nr:putative metalloprotease CJM1_0395 family protein [Polyangia bacterium]
MSAPSSVHLRIDDNGTSAIGTLREREPSRARPAPSDDGSGSSDAAPGVVVRLSPEAQRRLGEPAPGSTSGDDREAVEPGEGKPADDKTDKADDTDKTAGAGKKLTPQDQQVVQKLAARDVAVRAHEAAHMAAAGGLGGGASYTYETGPDGRRYAVGGEVPVQLASGRTPDETIQNAETVRAAALAPADPSAQDLAVAAQASQMEAQARQQKAAQQTAAAATPTTADGASGARSSDPLHDSLMVFSAIKAERGADASGGGIAHMHSGGDCPFCRAAAGKYGA